MQFFSPPNQLTYLRIILTPVFIVFLFSSSQVMRQWSLTIFILAAITDWYDGWVARKWGYVSRWGTFLDPLADKVLTSAALIAYSYLGLVESWMVWVIVVRDIFITLLRSYAEYKGKPVNTTLTAKIKTGVQFVVIYYLLILYVANNTPYFIDNYGELIDALLNYSLVYVLMSITTLLTVWTGISHIYTNWNVTCELFHLPEIKRNTTNPISTEDVSVFWKFFASGFFTGFIPFAPGTFASILAVGFFLIPGFESPILFGAVIIISFIFGLLSSTKMEDVYGKDPAEVTIDEIVGMWIALFLIPKTFITIISAIIIFRIIDIIKPYPIKNIEKLNGGTGIMLDDVVAGIYTNISIIILMQFQFFINLF